MPDITTWTRRVRPPGEIELVSPDGILVSIRERVRPVRPLRALAGAAPTTSLRTIEGEDAELASFVRDGVERAVALIEGDDFQTVIDGRAERAEQRTSLRDVVADVAKHFPLGLGNRRVRRVRHDGPPGWREERSGLVSTWHAPDDDATIKVLPARPLGEPPRAVQLATLCHDDRFDELELDRPIEHTPLSFRGLDGTVSRAVGRRAGGARRLFLTAGLADAQFRYVVRLDRADVDHDAAFLAVVRSCEPIVPSAQASAVVSAMAHWVD